ncbi:MAG TPA: sigma-70 domain-containing protein [Candidatus Dormibacteraeota bacterium]
MHADDTDLDALAAQVRAVPALDLEEVGHLLPGAAAAGPARERLVQDQLRVALDEVLTRRDRGVDVVDLFQEASVAAIVAVSEYADRGGPPEGLHRYVGRVIGVHLEAAIEEAEIERRSDEAFVRDAQSYEDAELNLRHELGRSATNTEIAALLAWPEERVAVVAEAVTAARQIWDSEIVQYLDDTD